MLVAVIPVGGIAATLAARRPFPVASGPTVETFPTFRVFLYSSHDPTLNAVVAKR